MPDDTLARVVHDTRRSFGAAFERPMKPAPWEERHPRQQELDRQIAAAVEAEVRVRVAVEIKDRARRLWPPGFQREELDAAAVAVVRGGQVQERSNEKEA